MSSPPEKGKHPLGAFPEPQSPLGNGFLLLFSVGRFVSVSGVSSRFPTAYTILLAYGETLAGLGLGPVVLHLLAQLLARAPRMHHAQKEQRRAFARRLQQSDAMSNLPPLKDIQHYLDVLRFLSNQE